MLQKLTCPNCTAPFILRKNRLTPVLNCQNCDTTSIITDLIGKDIDLPDTKFIAFNTDAEAFKTALLRWLADGDLTPDDILEKVSVQEFNGLFMPFWRISGRYDVQFHCEANINRTHIIEDAQGNKKTKTVADWKEYRSSARGSFKTVIYADESGKGKRVGNDLLSFLEKTAEEASNYSDFDPDALEEHMILDFTIPREEALEGRGNAKQNAMLKLRCKNSVVADDVRKIKLEDTMYYSLEHIRLIHPFWLANFKYKGKHYQVAFSGLELTVRHGDRPVDHDRKKIFEELDKPVQTATILTGIATIIGLFFFFIPGIIAFIVGVIMISKAKATATKEKQKILDRSYRIRQEILKRETGLGTPLETHITAEALAELKELTRDPKDKIKAIKAYEKLTGKGLKEAKAFVENPDWEPLEAALREKNISPPPSSDAASMQ
ncbi:MAG: ribosomal protein L7/L12, partial [Myxococcota bacterium]|nr:ribosomal protein L7/L12 [Myxococcota bacterium]